VPCSRGESFQTASDGGLPAVARFIWILAYAALQAWHAQSAELPALMAGAMILMMTGKIVRRPIFWSFAAMCLTVPTIPCRTTA